MAESPTVTLFVGTDREMPAFRRTSEAAAADPHILAAEDLRTAATLASRLETREVPLLHIHAPTPERPTTRHPHRSAIGFAQQPRLLAGLIADAVRAGVCAGAVVTTPADPEAHLALRTEITTYLAAAGFAVTHEVVGWELDTIALRCAS